MSALRIDREPLPPCGVSIRGSPYGGPKKIAWRPLPVNPCSKFLQIPIPNRRKLMSDVRRKYDEKFKRNAVKLS